MVFVYGMYGLGGRIWSRAMEDYIAAHLRNIEGVKVYPTRAYSEWRQIASQIKAQPKGAKNVVIGHSMGAGSATWVTDEVFVDLVVCYDAAGRFPVGIAKNCGKLFDFWDRAMALVPKRRPWAYPGHEHKIIRVNTNIGHTRQPTQPNLLHMVANEVKALKGS
jgi:hypothetical protein